jgi:hypothetical protein
MARPGKGKWGTGLSLAFEDLDGLQGIVGGGGQLAERVLGYTNRKWPQVKGYSAAIAILDFPHFVLGNGQQTVLSILMFHGVHLTI